MTVTSIPARGAAAPWTVRSTDARDRGFTLIELLVVVIIVGLMAAIAVPIYLNQRKKAIQSQMLHDAHSIALAFEAYRADHDHYPDVSKDWNFIGQYTDTAVTTSTMISDGLMPPLSPLVRTHSFDIAGYIPGFRLGQAFCIEIYHPQGGPVRYYRSDKGGWISTPCASA